MRISDWSSDVCSSDLMRSACCAAAGCRHDQRYTEPLCDLVRLILADIKPGNGAVEQCLKRIDMLARPMLAFRAGVKRSEERRVGKEGVSKCRFRGALSH